ncbi:MAG: hypothetical protein E7459_09295 [Ruminococcaceae bacterium]|nr:hypothetical protein [Oscillospiraceae bacterium]
MDENQLYQEQRAKLTTLQSLLQPGEQLLWHGAPARGIRFRAGDLQSSLMGLFVLGFAVFWCTGAAQAGGVFWLFGLLPLSIGLHMSVLRYLTEARSRKNTYYGITNQKIILMEPKAIDTITYAQIPCLELEPGKNGEGCIYLSPARIPTVRKGRQVMATDSHRKGLYHIRDAVKVYGLIQQQQAMKQ